MNSTATPMTVTAGAAIFARLKSMGIDYVFANSGTDFPPIIEGLAEAHSRNIDLPTAIAIPHEHAAMGMAHGYYLISGKPQAVMLHTNVGTANAAIGMINAACEHIPMIVMSGRTPTLEEGRFGARTVPIGWGQEMRDQGSLIREASKWEYELRFPEQIIGLLDRASAIASSTPKGPVYLTLPREILCENISADDLNASPSMAPAQTAPDHAGIEAAAELIANARSPLIIAQRGAGDASSYQLFSEWVNEYAIPVCTWWATHLAIPTEHPCHIGQEPGAFLREADVVVVLNAIAPWWPDKHQPNPDAKIINIGPDPIFSRVPVRNFRSDISLTGETSATIPILVDAVRKKRPAYSVTSLRRQQIQEHGDASRAQAEKSASENNAVGITKAWVSKCLGEALKDKNSSVFTELGTILGTLERSQHRSWFQEPHSGGLGWSFPAALGAKLADPYRICVATCGDGSYMFSNPTACHQIAEALGLPVLVIVLNNASWGAVKASVTGLYPDGYAAKTNRMPLTTLEPSPDFCLTAQASRAWTREVSRADEVPNILEEAIRVVETTKQHALLNIKIID